MTATLVQVLNVARSQIGHVEGRDNANPYAPAVGFADHEPWCDSFVSWAFWRAGAQDIGGRFAYCPSHVEWFRRRGQLGRVPRVGAVVFFDWSGRGVAEHVGLVEAVLPDGRLQTIEGNTSRGDAGSQSDGGGVWRRFRSPKFVLAYGYPAYGAPIPARGVFGGDVRVHFQPAGELAQWVESGGGRRWVSPAEWHGLLGEAGQIRKAAGLPDTAKTAPGWPVVCVVPLPASDPFWALPVVGRQQQ